jgi:flagella basal body P-ring formation protein FlgA
VKLPIAILFTARAFACHAVDGDHILAKDLAAAIPALASLDPAARIAPAPAPGVERVLHAQEIARIARARGQTIDTVGDVCFERATEALTQERLLPALREALGIDGAEVTILDFSRTGVPRGELKFSRTGLRAQGLWRGQVMYGSARSVPVWVKVRVTTEQSWVEAVQPLEAGRVVDTSKLTVRNGQRFPFSASPLASIELAVGRKPLRGIKAGEPIFANMLTTPREVERGDKVAVAVTSGDARIQFEATAESSGHTGEMVLVRNPENGRDFQARVSQKGRVTVSR